MTTFSAPQGQCLHFRRLKFDPCSDCLKVLASAEIDDWATMGEHGEPQHSDGGAFADPAYRGVG
jgi:hypothetical protein